MSRLTLGDVVARQLARRQRTSLLNAERMRRVAAGLPGLVPAQRQGAPNSDAAAPARATASTTSTTRTRLDGCW